VFTEQQDKELAAIKKGVENGAISNKEAEQQKREVLDKAQNNFTLIDKSDYLGAGMALIGLENRTPESTIDRFNTIKDFCLYMSGNLSEIYDRFYKPYIRDSLIEIMGDEEGHKALSSVCIEGVPKIAVGGLTDYTEEF